MVEQHIPAMLEDRTGVPQSEGIEGLLPEIDENQLEVEIVEERRHSPRNDRLESLMAERQFPAVYDNDGVAEPQAGVERQPHTIEHSVLELDIIQRERQDSEQDGVYEGDLTETTSPTSMDNAPVPATGERGTVELPVELHEHIIGFLDNWDVETISNCALVCRRWVPFSRFKLYHCIPLQYRRQWAAFEHLMSLPASSSMAEYYLGKVQHLWIWPEDKKFFDDEKKQPRIGWRKGQERGWTHLVLVRWATRLPGLTCISFWYVDWREHYHVVSLRSGNTWHTITTLELLNCTFASIVQLHMFVTAFPALSDLSLRCIDLQSKKTLHIPTGGHPLTRLELGIHNDAVMIALIRWLAHADLVQNLADLEWWPNTADQWKILTEGIDGPSLEKLDLRDVPRDSPVNFSRFSSIRVLTLRYTTWSLEWCLETFNHHLSSISSNQLDELHIGYVPISSASSLDSTLATFTQLKAIDDLLAGPKFTHLRRVALEYEELNIFIQAIPGTSSPSPSEGRYMPVSSSRSQPDSSYQLVSTPSDSPEVDRRDPQHPFRIYAEPLLRRKTRDEMKQLNARGILEIELTVLPCQQRRLTRKQG